MIRYLCVITFVLSVMCSSARSEKLGQLELLYAIGIGADSVSIEVRSQGCTKKEHFKLGWASTVDTELAPRYLRVVRVVPDRCRAKPRRVTLQLPFNPPASRVIHVENHFQVWGSH